MPFPIKLTESSVALKFAPQYIARELGFLGDESIRITEDVHAGPAGSWLVQNLQNGKADIALGGVWLPMVFNQVSEIILKPFAVACRINPAVILKRATDTRTWTWENLYGKRVLLSLAATSQWMFLRGVLKEKGIDLTRIHFVRDLHAETTRELWKSGYGDFFFTEAVAAQEYIESGSAVAATMAEAAGPVPWSVYYATEGFINENSETVAGFRSAINSAVSWLYEQPSEVAVDVLKPYFPSPRTEILVKALDMLKLSRTWPQEDDFEMDALARYESFMVDYGLIDAADFSNVD